MSKKDILKSGEFMPTPVGRHVYVWSPGGRKPAARSRDCVISAHGGAGRINGTIKGSRPEKLLFYCPHGYVLSAPPILSILSGQVKPYEPVPTNELRQDYVLTKFQGRHQGENSNGMETYGYLQHGMHSGAQKDSVTEGFLDSFERNEKKPNHPLYAINKAGLVNGYIESMNSIKAVEMDVVTIRYRSVSFGEVTLYGVIEALEKHGFQYRNVHCSFCRVTPTSKGDWSTSQNVN